MEVIKEIAPFCVFCGLDVDLLECFAMDDPEMAKRESFKLYADVLGNYWCEEHWYRGKLMNWGMRHGWPLLHLSDGTVGNNTEDVNIIPDGAYGWYMCLVVSKNEAVGYLVEGIIEMLESEEKAS